MQHTQHSRMCLSTEQWTQHTVTSAVIWPFHFSPFGLPIKHAACHHGMPRSDVVGIGAGSRPPAHRGLTPGAAGLSGKAGKMPRLALALWPPWARRPPGPPPLLQPLEAGPAGFASERARGACRKCQVAHLALCALARAPVTEQRGTWRRSCGVQKKSAFSTEPPPRSARYAASASDTLSAAAKSLPTCLAGA